MAKKKPDKPTPGGSSVPGDLPDVPGDLPDAVPAPPPPGGRARLPSRLARKPGRAGASPAVPGPGRAGHRHATTEAYQTRRKLKPVQEPAGGGDGAGGPDPAGQGAETLKGGAAAPAADKVGFKPAGGSRKGDMAKGGASGRPRPAPPSKGSGGPSRVPAAGGAGVSLREVLGRGGLDTDRAVRLMGRVCSHLQRLHADKQSHGALTPAHIRFVPDETHGSVELVEVPARELPAAYRALYMAPEATGAADTTNPRLDVYALGCMLFEALTGRAPFVGKNAAQIKKRHARFAVPAARQVRRDIELPPALELQLQRALKKRAGDRHASAGELATAVAMATEEDDRGTLHLSLDEAKVLQELIAQKTEGAEQKKQLDAEQRRIEEEKKRVAADKARIQREKRAAEEARRQAEAARRRAKEERAKVEQSVVVAQSAARKSNLGLLFGLLGLMIAGGGLVYFLMNDAPPPPPPVPRPAVAIDAGAPPPAPDAGGEPDAGPPDAGPPDTGPPDAGLDTAVEEDTGFDAGKKAVRRPRSRPRPRPRPQHPKPRPKPKPARNLPVTF